MLTKDVAQDIEYVIVNDLADDLRDCRKEHALLIKRREEATRALDAANIETRKCKDALSAARVRLCWVTIVDLAART